MFFSKAISRVRSLELPSTIMISSFLHHPRGIASMVGPNASSSFRVGRITVTVTGSFSPMNLRQRQPPSKHWSENLNPTPMNSVTLKPKSVLGPLCTSPWCRVNTLLDGEGLARWCSTWLGIWQHVATASPSSQERIKDERHPNRASPSSKYRG